MNRYYVDWDEINALVFRLRCKIGFFKNIYGLQRGGLIPAVMLSHQLGIPMAKGDIGPDTLIVDDICDSGETLDKLVKKYQTLYSFPLTLKQQSYIINLILHALHQHSTQKNGIGIFG